MTKSRTIRTRQTRNRAIELPTPQRRLNLEVLEQRNLLDADFAEINNSFDTAYTFGSISGYFNEPNLNVHQAFDDDYFLFQTTGTGEFGHFVEIDFAHDYGDLDMALYDGSVRPVRGSVAFDHGILTRRGCMTQTYACFARDVKPLLCRGQPSQRLDRRVRRHTAAAGGPP